MNNAYPSKAQLLEALRLIQAAILDEEKDAKYYDWLADNVPTNLPAEARDKIVRILNQNAADERTHQLLFKAIYHQLTGKQEPTSETEINPHDNFLDGLEDAIIDETDAVRTYRRIYAAMPNNSYRDQLYSIITDEQRHAALDNLVYNMINHANEQHE